MIRAGGLFELEQLVATPENQEVFKFIRNAKSIPWPPFSFSTKPLSEQRVLLEIVRRILVPLCREDEVILEKNYSTLISNLGPVAAGIKTGYIGIGSWKTWHGSPDARVRGSEVIGRNVSLLRLDVEEYEEYEEYDSDGESDDTRGTDGATKLRFTDQNFSQLVATSVVSSFTES